MYRYLLVFLLFLSFGCTLSKKPEFINVKNIKIVSVNSNKIEVKTDILFKNKNSVGGTLQAKDIHVFVDNTDVAIVKTEAFKVPKKSEFILPLLVEIPYKKVFKDNKQNLLVNIMNMVIRKEILMQYKGNIRYSLGKLHYDYPLDYTQKVTITK